MPIPAGSRGIFIHPSGTAGQPLIESLRAGGMDLTTARTVKEAVRLAHGGIDVIILYASPGHDIAASCRTLRGDASTRQAPLLVLTDQVLKEADLGKILSAGALDVLTAPLSDALLLARVGNMVRIHQEEINLRETQQRYRRIFDSSNYGYFLSSREGRFVEVNDALLHILGYRNRAEVLRLKLPDDLYVNPEDRAILQKLIEKKGFVKDFKVDFKRRDGSTVTILLTASLYKGPDGKTLGYEGLNIPLSDTDVPGRLRRWLTQPLRNLFARRRNFLSVSRVSELVANQYEKVEELSEGYYSSVWRGRDVLGFEEAPLVIKISKSEAINERLLMEAQVIRSLAGHPGVPELVDLARHKGRTVVVTRFVEGQPLQKLLPMDDPVQRDRVSWQLMDVVAHLHRNGVVHRDIKPDNIVMRPDGSLVLLDYGIVKRMGEGETSATVIGTRPYMSPEQINGMGERRSDVWAIGVVMYQLYTGRMPFYGSTEIELMNNILDSTPPVPRSLNPDLPAAMESVLIRALRKKPEGRFDDAGQMRDQVVNMVPGFIDNVRDLI